MVGSIRLTSPTTGGGLSSPLIWLMSSDNPFVPQQRRELGDPLAQVRVVLGGRVESPFQIANLVVELSLVQFELVRLFLDRRQSGCAAASVCCRLASTSSRVLLAVCSAATSWPRAAVIWSRSRLFSSSRFASLILERLGLGGERHLRVLEPLLGGFRYRLGVLHFLLELVDLFCSSLVATIQFFDVVKTTVDRARKSKEKAMITITRILPTKVMVPSYQSEVKRPANHPRDVAATSRKWDGAWTVCHRDESPIKFTPRSSFWQATHAWVFQEFRSILPGRTSAVCG